MESLDPGTIASMKKRQNATHRYAEILRDLRRRRISYSLNFIFGWDTETRSVFQTTLSFLHEQKVPAAYFNLLTPDKGTAYYDRMLQSDRIIHGDDIGRWPGHRCHIHPTFCGPQELEQEVQNLHRRFYSLPSIFSRLSPPLTKADIASWVINFSQRRVAHDLLESMNFGTY
jgi:hypothetical protein